METVEEEAPLAVHVVGLELGVHVGEEGHDVAGGTVEGLLGMQSRHMGVELIGVVEYQLLWAGWAGPVAVHVLLYGMLTPGTPKIHIIMLSS